MATKRPADPHEPSFAEIVQAKRNLNERLILLQNRGNELADAARKAGSHHQAAPLSEHARAVHAETDRLMNGYATPNLLAPTVSQEEEIAIQIGGTLGAILKYDKMELPALDRESRQWAIDH